MKDYRKEIQDLRDIINKLKKNFKVIGSIPAHF